MSASQRKLKNYLINPVVQLRLSAISLALLIIFALAVLGAAYFSLVDLFETLVELSDVQAEVQRIVAAEVANFGSWLIVLFIMFILITTTVIIFESHKVVGAAYAINRHIRQNLLEGHYDRRLTLRKGDFLQDVAQSINELTEKLENENSKDSN